MPRSTRAKTEPKTEPTDTGPTDTEDQAADDEHPTPTLALDAVTGTGTSDPADTGGTTGTHHMVVSVTGRPVLLTVNLQVSHDSKTWVEAGIVTGSATGDDPAVFTVTDHTPARYVRVQLSALAGGVDPTVTATVASA